MSNKKRSQVSDNTTTTTAKAITPKDALPQTQDYWLTINDKQALLITLLIGIISYFFSFNYTAFYQGEEGAQYMDALGFTHNLKLNPQAIMGNWPKTGWKIIYGPIAVMFGKQGVLIANCLFASFSGFFSYKLASKIMERKTALPFIFLISQTLWFILCYKFYSEIPTAFLLVLGIYLFYCEKFIPAALTLSYVLLLRQEFVFIMPYFAVVLLKRKQWIAFFCLGAFSLIYNFAGYLQTGDFLYSIHESIKYSNMILGSAPRQGFDNFFVMSGAIYNHVVVCLVILYLAQVALRQVEKIEWHIIVPAVGFFIIHCLFNVKLDPADPNFNPTSLMYPSIVLSLLVIIAVRALLKKESMQQHKTTLYIGAAVTCLALLYFKDAVVNLIHNLPTTGGNLRYVLVVSPLLAVLAAKAIDNMRFVKNRMVLLFFLLPLFGLVAATMTYPHNWIVMITETGDRDYLPILLCILTIILILVIKNIRMLTISVTCLCALSMLLYVKADKLCCTGNCEKLNNENCEQKKITDYVIANKLDQKPIMQNLALMNFFMNKNNWDYKNGCYQMYGDSTLDKAKVGTVIIWDTHYATKYGKVEYAYFQKNQQKYKLIKEFRSEDDRFAAIIVEKVAM